MGRKTTPERKRRERLALFNKQAGLCYWCRRPMRLHPDGSSARTGTNDADAATIDHLHPKGHPERGTHQNEFTHVLACHKCNHDRNEEFMERQPKESLWAASGRAPRSATS